MSSPLILTLREPPAHRLDLSALQPDVLSNLDMADIAGLPLCLGRRRYGLADLFEIDGDDVTDIVVRNACKRLDGIGTKLRTGRITVDGDAGHYLGRAMSGGEIRVAGNCADYAASRMSAGQIEIQGNAGAFIGAPRAGERIGMSGGTVVVRGSAGDRCGDRMRRGTVVIHGDAGACAASRMIAGTIAIAGTAGERAGTAMQRGTLVLAHPAVTIPATFNASSPGESVYMALMLRALARIDERFAALSALQTERLVGDRACGGLGEIFVFKPM
ncbi:MAG: formylmethanofuran dehydrogenase subunit C [Gammaproteobacteria bacterium]